MKKLTPLLFLCLLSACMVGPDYFTPQTDMPEKWENAAVNNQKKPKDIREEIVWWENYKDPILNQLIQETINFNCDLKAAFANISQARAALLGAEAAFNPEIDVMASGNNNENSLNALDISNLQGINNNIISPPLGNGSLNRFFNLYWTGFSTTWEIDLFGRLRRGIESAEASLESQVEDMHATLLSLISDVAFNYINLRSTQKQLALTEKSFQAWDSIYKLNQALLTAGLATDVDVLQAKAARDQTKASLFPLQALVKTTIHQLSILCGKPPTCLYKLLSKVKPIPQVPPEIFAGLPSELLKRRPDIRAAERNLAASSAQIGVAQGSIFPIVSLTGLLGYQSNFASNFFAPGSVSYIIGPGVTWSFIDFGRVRSKVNASIAARDASLAQYKSTLLSALADVETSLVNYATEASRYYNLSIAYNASKQAADCSLLRYEAGLASFLTALRDEITSLAYAINVLQSQTTFALYSVSLYKALGGGWEIDKTCWLKEDPLVPWPEADGNS